MWWGMSESLESLMSRLQAEYLDEIPARLDEIRMEMAALATEQSGAKDRLGVLFHRLAGSAGAYGFGDVTVCCRRAEGALEQSPSPEVVNQLQDLIKQIEAAFAAGPTTFPIAP